MGEQEDAAGGICVQHPRTRASGCSHGGAGMQEPRSQSFPRRKLGKGLVSSEPPGQGR